MRVAFCCPAKSRSPSALNQTFAHQKRQHLSFGASPNRSPICGSKSGPFNRSAELFEKLLTRRGGGEERPKRCQAVSKLAEGGRSTASFVAFPTKEAQTPFKDRRASPNEWTERNASQARFKWASFYLGLTAAAAGLLRSNAKLVLAISLMLAAYAMRSGVLDMFRAPFEDPWARGGGPKAAIDDQRGKQGNQNGVKAHASGGQQLAVERTPVAAEATAMEVVGPVHFMEEGLRPVRDTPRAPSETSARTGVTICLCHMFLFD